MEEPKTFLKVLQWSPQEARDYLEKIRWPDGPVCPNGCASEVYRFESKTRRKAKNGETKVQPKRYLLKCKQCKRQFTPTIGTIFEDSHIPLNKWLAAIWLMVASKKGISAHQLHRMLDVTYKSAWYMAHRVRHAMRDRSGPLKGIIEADETYVGGKPRGPMKNRRGQHQREVQRKVQAKKTPVFGILERGGRVRTVVMPGINKPKVIDSLRQNVTTGGSVLMTDESPLYGDVKAILPHRTVKHQSEYVTSDGIHTQGIEGFWSILKRQLYGTHHHVEVPFLGMYAQEVAFRYNARKMSDAERFALAMQSVPGGRLSWFASSEGESQTMP